MTGRGNPPTLGAGTATAPELPPLPLPAALASLVRCGFGSLALFAQREIAQPSHHVGDVLHFADRSHGRVYRETVRRHAETDDPVVLVVGFRLRWVHGQGHRLFRAESLLNTVLFVGFRGFVSKLWLAHDEAELYRGVYQWNGEALAHAYVRALWWVLAIVSVRGSIHSVVLPGLRRDDVLDDPSVLDGVWPDQQGAWWRITAAAKQSSAQGVA